jgi:hypothetical protein
MYSRGHDGEFDSISYSILLAPASILSFFYWKQQQQMCVSVAATEFTSRPSLALHD